MQLFHQKVIFYVFCSLIYSWDVIFCVVLCPIYIAGMIQASLLVMALMVIVAIFGF